MNEEKKLNEQELDQVAGGAGYDERFNAKFEQEWALFEQSHCSQCTVYQKCIESPSRHDDYKRNAAKRRKVLPNLGIECPSYCPKRH